MLISKKKKRKKQRKKEKERKKTIITKKNMNADTLLDDSLYYLTNNLPKCEKPITLKTGRVVACGYCPLCIERKRKDWITRNRYELLQNPETMFITLTFDNEHLKNTSYTQIQLFLKRLRKYIHNFISKTKIIKYFGCYENGEKSGRPHYHIIIYGAYIQPRTNKHGIIIETTNEIIGRIWGNGIANVKPVMDEKAILYITKYMLKQEEPDPDLFTSKVCYNKYNKYEPFNLRRKNFLFMSKGLGFNFLNSKQDIILQKNYISSNGYKLPIPRSYIEKLKRENLFTRDENNEEIINKEFENYITKNKIEKITLQNCEDYVIKHYNKYKELAKSKRSKQ